MLARIRKTAAVVTATTLALASTFVGTAFLAGFVEGINGEKTVAETKVEQKAVVQPTSTATPTATPISKTEAPKTFEQTTEEIANILEKHIVDDIGCGVVDSEYKVKLTSYMLILADSTKSQFDNLNEKQIKLVVGETVRQNPEKVDLLVADFRNRYCNATQAAEQEFVGSHKTSRKIKVDYQEIGEKTVVVRTNDGRLNCRAIPQGEIVRKYPQNMELTVNAQSDDNWYRTTDGCWVSGKHVVEATQATSGYTPEEAQLEASIDQSVPVVETQSYASSGSGRCDTPDQLDSRGRRCGGRAASVRPGGRRRR